MNAWVMIISQSLRRTMMYVLTVYRIGSGAGRHTTSFRSAGKDIC
jgi:hypothetical protein